MSIDTLSPPIEWKNRPLAVTSTYPASGIMPTWQETESGARSVPSEGGATPTTVFRAVSVTPPLVRQFRSRPDEVTLLEKWEGFVTAVLPDGFCAEFQRNASDQQAVVAEFDLSDLSDDDQVILAEGMPLVWSITRERRRGGIQRCSVLYLRRQPSPSPAEDATALELLNRWIAPDEAHATNSR